MRKIIFIIVLLLVLAGLYWASTGYYSKGKRAGTISKNSERGYIFKTNEGQLNEGGFSGETGSVMPRLWDFSAKDPEVIKLLDQALMTGERVTLEYEQKFFTFPWNGDTKYFITAIEFLPKPAVLPPPSTTAPQVPAVQDTATAIK